MPRNHRIIIVDISCLAGGKDNSGGEQEGDKIAPKAAAAKKQKREAEGAPKQKPTVKKSKTKSVDFKENGRGIAGQSLAVKEGSEAECEAAPSKILALGSSPFR
jgi:hypothetical protein